MSDWRKDLGAQVKAARIAKGMSQEKLAESVSVTRSQLSNIEHGKSAPAVNIVAEIARELETEFEIHGIKIGGTAADMRPRPVATQMSLSFDVEYHFGSGSLRMSSRPRGGMSVDVKLNDRVA